MSFWDQLSELLRDPLLWSGPTGIPTRLSEHVRLSALAVAVAAAAALPVALYVGHRRRGQFLAVAAANVGRALPSFAVIALLLVVSIRAGLGLGFWPTAGAMVLLAIAPIVTNTYVAIEAVDADAVEAARGMGMSELQLLVKVELPLAAPLIIAGIRTASVQVIATATLGAVVAWGGLGRFIVDGFAIGNKALAFLGAALVALLAIATELAFAVVQRAVAPGAGRAAGPTREASVTDASP